MVLDKATFSPPCSLQLTSEFVEALTIQHHPLLLHVLYDVILHSGNISLVIPSQHRFPFFVDQKLLKIPLDIMGF